jgi:hypothetical protein
MDEFPLTTKRLVHGHVAVCRGCCCGNTANGKPAVPVEWLKKLKYIVLLSLATILCAPAPAQVQVDIGDLSRRFEDQQGPVRKAKYFPKLGDAYLRLMRQQVKTGYYEQALTVLETYIETIKNLRTTLSATVRDPEEKSDGFRQLEEHLRKSIRILNDVAVEVPLNQRDPFEAGIRELQEADSELIKVLFPRRPRLGK